MNTEVLEKRGDWVDTSAWHFKLNYFAVGIKYRLIASEAQQMRQ